MISYSTAHKDIHTDILCRLYRLPSNVLKKPLLATFFGIFVTAIIIVGYLLNAILQPYERSEP